MAILNTLKFAATAPAKLGMDLLRKSAAPKFAGPLMGAQMLLDSPELNAGTLSPQEKANPQYNGMRPIPRRAEQAAPQAMPFQTAPVVPSIATSAPARDNFEGMTPETQQFLRDNPAPEDPSVAQKLAAGRSLREQWLNTPVGQSLGGAPAASPLPNEGGSKIFKSVAANGTTSYSDSPMPARQSMRAQPATAGSMNVSEADEPMGGMSQFFSRVPTTALNAARRDRADNDSFRRLVGMDHSASARQDRYSNRLSGSYFDYANRNGL